MQTGIHTYRDTHTGRHTYTQAQTHTYIQTERHTYIHTYGETGRLSGRHTHIQRHTDR